MSFKLIRANLRLADLVLMLALIVIMIASIASKRMDKAELRVFIYKDNVLWGDYPLAENRTLRIDDHNTIQIKDHKYSMMEADCPDRRCVKQGWTGRLPIICLPNRVSIEVRAAGEASPNALF